MCLAVPMKIIEIEGNKALVEQEGVSRRVRVDFMEKLQPGDYILVHAGMAIERISPQEADETLRLIRMLADEVH